MTAGDTERGPIAYVMSRFPKLTETFVFDEILEMERQGESVEIFPLWREQEQISHQEVAALVDRAHFLPLISGEIVRDLLYWLIRRPWDLLAALATLITANISSLRYLGGGLAAFPKACTMARQMQRLGVTHLHAHFASHPAAIAFVIARLTGIPFSFTAHGSDLHREQAMLPEKVRAARFVVAISDYNRRFILEHVGEEQSHKIRVVHCGVDVTGFYTGKAGSEVLNIVCIGTLHEVKGQRFLLDACAKLEAVGTPWRCHFIGDGPDRAQLEALARDKGIIDKVVFHGNCDRARVRELLAQMSIGCAPSVPTANGRREGIPVALIEAGASALPLVASRLSGIPELIAEGDNGLLAEPGDSEALAGALVLLATDRSMREKMGLRARGTVEREFSLSSGVRRLRHLIAEYA